MKENAIPDWLSDRVAGRKLTAGQARIVAALGEAPENFLMVNVKVFAGLAGVAPATVSRCIQFLGYAGYTDFQRELKEKLFQPHKLTSVFNYLEADPADSFDLIKRIREAETAELQQGLEAIDQATLHEAAMLTASAKRVHLMGFGSSNALLRFLQYRLMRVGLDVVDMTPVSEINMLAEHCVHMNARQDVIITVGFRGVYDTMTHLLRFAATFQIPSIAFSENPDSEISRLSTYRIPIKRTVINGFKSLGVPMILLNLFVMQTARYFNPGKDTISRRLVWFRKYQEANRL